MIKIIRNPDGTYKTCGEMPLPKAQRAVKKPIPIKVRQINEPFSVETLEGTMKGKAGDWLMEGVNGEMYPCDAEVFSKTHDIIT